MDRGDYDYDEQDIASDSLVERRRQQRKPHRGGKITREEPTNLVEMQASPLAVSCFRYLGCFIFMN